MQLHDSCLSVNDDFVIERSGTLNTHIRKVLHFMICQRGQMEDKSRHDKVGSVPADLILIFQFIDLNGVNLIVTSWIFSSVSS